MTEEQQGGNAPTTEATADVTPPVPEESTAAIAVAFGVVFWAWNALWAAASPIFVAAPPAQNILYGTWLAAAVVAGLVVQKPGAALFAELVAASVSLACADVGTSPGRVHRPPGRPARLIRERRMRSC